MKKIFYHILSALAICTLADMMSSCINEPLVDDNIAKEMYTRGFIKKFGLINQHQDWNSAQPTDISFIPGADGAKTVDALIQACGAYYLVATYSDIDCPVRMDVELPKGIENVYLAVDGKMYATTPGGTVDARVSSRDDDKDTPDPEGTTHDAPDASTYNNLGWLIAAEDLGESDDFDFNDVIVKMEYDMMTSHFALTPLDWEGVNNNVSMHMAKSRTETGKNLRVTAMAAGGTLPVWLHYVDASNNDYVISPNAPDGYILSSNLTAENKYVYEWHQWFYGMTSNVIKPSKSMINTSDRSNRGREVVLPASLLGNFGFSDYSKNYSNNNSKTDNIKGFYISVEHQDEEGNIVNIVAADPGFAPQMFLIPDIGWSGEPSEPGTQNVCGWHWPRERVDITVAYSNFRNWVSKPADNANWYTEQKSSTSSKVYVRRY